MEIQFPQILFQAINFFTVFGALVFLLYKPILKIFDERSKRIEEGQKAAEEAIKQRESIGQLEKDTRSKLEKEAAVVMERAVEQANEQKEQILSEARSKALQEIAQLKDKWEAEKSQRIKNWDQDLAKAVIQTAQKVLEESIDSKKHQKLINDELNRIIASL